MKNKLFLFSLLILMPCLVSAQKSGSLHRQISDTLTNIANEYTYVGVVNNIRLSVDDKRKQVTVNTSDRLSNIAFRNENVARINKALRAILAARYPGYDFRCVSNGKQIEELVPNLYRGKQLDKNRRFKLNESDPPLLTKLSLPYRIDRGLQNRHIALWQSHGWYYNLAKRRWEWQRPRLLQTVEDLYTQSYVLPFLLPMLENAGANVLLPLERDTQRHEVIVDNDNPDGGIYTETKGAKTWKTGNRPGFAHNQERYIQGENPFERGSYRWAESVSNREEANSVTWTPVIPEAGYYAVYVSYHTLENSVSDARYTVRHLGGETEFSVNQRMGGGTWIYLGHFRFERGSNPLTGSVKLTNFSRSAHRQLTADAVKFGGGMGNIARAPKDSSRLAIKLMQPIEKMLRSCPLRVEMPPLFPPQTSGRPRFAEAARYWLQWAGMPDSIYSFSAGENDYTDDARSRGYWVNYMAGGSAVMPKSKGLKIPLNLSFSFHTDAGTTPNDSLIGTLSIFSTEDTEKNSLYPNRVSRWAARDLADIVQSQIVEDIRRSYDPKWTRRGLWNKPYIESRLPKVPAMLLELLSHQNFADMRYGLDPRFRFTVSRSIYKGMLRYLAEANGFDYVVQPLPVEKFNCRFVAENELELNWEAVSDSLEVTAEADKFVLYTRIDDGGFDNGKLVKGNTVRVHIIPGKIYSFRVTAVNRGGESFPSEILSAYRDPRETREVLIINAFERISAPASFEVDTTYAGFRNDIDAGVPYMAEIGFTGRQYEFRRQLPWVDNDAPGFGASHADQEATVIAGNTFDYPYLHGEALKAAGYSFVSCAVKALADGRVDMAVYPFVDLILGKQRRAPLGSYMPRDEFRAFRPEVQQKIRAYCAGGGRLLISGAHWASDLCEGDSVSPVDRDFAEQVLKIKLRTSHASVGGAVCLLASPCRNFAPMNFDYYHLPNEKSYYVESPDAIEPAHSDAFSICRYAENGRSAAVAYKGNYRLCLWGFPLETIVDTGKRESLMKAVMTFFE